MVLFQLCYVCLCSFRYLLKFPSLAFILTVVHLFLHNSSTWNCLIIVSHIIVVDVILEKLLIIILLRSRLVLSSLRFLLPSPKHLEMLHIWIILFQVRDLRVSGPPRMVGHQAAEYNWFPSDSSLGVPSLGGSLPASLYLAIRF